MIVLKCGYNEYKLPDNVKVDQLKCLIDAVHLESSRGVHHLNSGEADISIVIRQDTAWANVLVKYDTPDIYKEIIAPGVMQSLSERKHVGTIRFLKEHIEIKNPNKKTEIRNYLELANPDEDPEKIIEELANAVK